MHSIDDGNETRKRRVLGSKRGHSMWISMSFLAVSKWHTIEFRGKRRRRTARELKNSDLATRPPTRHDLHISLVPTKAAPQSTVPALLLSNLTQIPSCSVSNTFSINPHRSSAPSVLEHCVELNNGTPEDTTLHFFPSSTAHLTFPMRKFSHSVHSTRKRKRTNKFSGALACQMSDCRCRNAQVALWAC